MKAISKQILLAILLVPVGVPAQQRTSALPAAAFVSRSAVVAPAFSPDGKHIAWLNYQGERFEVMVRETEGAEVRTLVPITEPEIYPRWLKWADVGRLLVNADISSASASSAQTWTHRVFAFDLDADHSRETAAADTEGAQEEWDVPLQDGVFHWQRGDPMHALVQCRDPGDLYPSVKLMDIDSGALTRLVPGHRGVQNWYADHDGAVRVGIGHQGDRYMLFARADATANFEKIEDFNPYRENGFKFAGFGFDPNTIYVWKQLGGRRALYEYSLSSKQIVRMVFAHPEVDVDALVFNQGLRKLIGVEYIKDGPQRHFLDRDAEREQAAIDRALPGTFNQVISQNKEHSRVIVRVSSDTHAPAYYLFVREGDRTQLQLLLSLYPQLPNEGLAPMRAVSYRARDGLTIPAYLTVPRGVEPRNLPVIVHPHGGPTTRDFREFDPEVQFLASRGFAVFQMNFRGSNGYGEQFREMGFRQWGEAMQNDITDGVRWLIEQGIADPDRIGIYGASYGGYAALMGLVKTPALYRAGAAYAAATSLPTFVAANPKMFADHRHGDRGGSVWRDVREQRANSPVDNANRIQAPVFLAHGEDDARVPVAHSRLMAEALRAAGKDVEYVEFAHESHGFLRAEDRVRFYQRLGDFFERHLAARVVGGSEATAAGIAAPTSGNLNRWRPDLPRGRKHATGVRSVPCVATECGTNRS